MKDVVDIWQVFIESGNICKPHCTSLQAPSTAQCSSVRRRTASDIERTQGATGRSNAVRCMSRDLIPVSPAVWGLKHDIFLDLAVLQ
jgi:hypothetical protein